MKKILFPALFILFVLTSSFDEQRYHSAAPISDVMIQQSEKGTITIVTISEDTLNATTEVTYSIDMSKKNKVRSSVSKVLTEAGIKCCNPKRISPTTIACCDGKLIKVSDSELADECMFVLKE